MAGIYLLINYARPSRAAVDQSITDVNGDGVINLVDARTLAPPQSTSCPVCVDVNGDKQINQSDMDLIKYNAGLGDLSEGSKQMYNPRLDINNDKTLSIDDVNIVQNYIGQTVTGPAFGLDDPSELTYGFASGEIIVKFKPEVSAQQKTSSLSQLNSTTKHTLSRVNADLIRVSQSNPENLQKQLASDPTIEKTYKNRVGEPAVLHNDPLWDQQWGNRKIRIEETWYTETVGSVGHPVRVAIIDTGVDSNHEDLQKNLSTYLNFVAVDPNPGMDSVAHGTFMAGIIGATVGNSKGIAGVIPNVEMISLRAGELVRAADGTFYPVYYDWAIGSAFDYAMSEIPDLKVINMSFCMGYSDDNNFLTADMMREAREEYNITLIAAAGNDGRNDSCYPARHPNVVSVGATTRTDALCSITNGRTDADILAPGLATSTIPLDRYENWGCGSSISAAYISGIAALCRTVRPLPESNEMTREDLKCRRFDHQGYGRVDAWATIWNRNCFKFDFNANGYIDSADSQSIGFRFNSPSQYNNRYDIAHVGGNGAIDMADVWKILSVAGLNCPPM